MSVAAPQAPADLALIWHVVSSTTAMRVEVLDARSEGLGDASATSSSSGAR
jgi:hypothetical protein